MYYRTLLAGGCLAALAPAAHAAKDKAPAPRPNVLVIYTDDMGVGDLSCLNNGWVQSPNLDRMASQGLMVRNFYTSAPISSPSRVGITTGMYPMQWGLYSYLSDRNHNRRFAQNDFLDPSAPTMAKVFKAAGYATGHFGKWHMGGGRDVDNAPQITRYGFDEYVSTWESPDPDPLLTGDPSWIWSKADSVRRWNRTAYFVDKTLDFLSRHKGEPCFVNLWPDDVHTPWVPSPEFEDDKKVWETPRAFRPVMEEYDRQIGRLMQRLAEMGLDKNTIVIFTSDNGPAPTFKQERTNGMRGAKAGLYEGGIRMPFIICWPGHIPAGKMDEQSVVCTVDLLPSLCAMTGAKLPAGYKGSGEDMSAALQGKPTVRKGDLMWEFGRSSAYAKPGNPNQSPHLAIRRGDWKLLTNSDDQTRTELYNLTSDPKEMKNVAAENPALTEELKTEALKWWDTRKERKEQ